MGPWCSSTSLTTSTRAAAVALTHPCCLPGSNQPAQCGHKIPHHWLGLACAGQHKQGARRASERQAWGASRRREAQRHLSSKHARPAYRARMQVRTQARTHTRREAERQGDKAPRRARHSCALGLRRLASSCARTTSSASAGPQLPHAPRPLRHAACRLACGQEQERAGLRATSLGNMAAVL